MHHNIAPSCISDRVKVKTSFTVYVPSLLISNVVKVVLYLENRSQNTDNSGWPPSCLHVKLVGIPTTTLPGGRMLVDLGRTKINKKRRLPTSMEFEFSTKIYKRSKVCGTTEPDYALCLVSVITELFPLGI